MTPPEESTNPDDSLNGLVDQICDDFEAAWSSGSAPRIEEYLEQLVKAGLAWHYVKYAPDNTALQEAEQQAREMNGGLWSNAHGSIPPWDWRKISKTYFRPHELDARTG